MKSLKLIGRIDWTNRSSGCLDAVGPGPIARALEKKIAFHSLKSKEVKKSCQKKEVVDEQAGARAAGPAVAGEEREAAAKAGAGVADRVDQELAKEQERRVSAFVQPVGPGRPMNAASPAFR